MIGVSMSFATRDAALEEISRLTGEIGGAFDHLANRLTDANLLVDSYGVAGAVLEKSSDVPQLKVLFEGSELDLSTASLAKLNQYVGALTATVQGVVAVRDTVNDPSKGGQHVVDIATGFASGLAGKVAGTLIFGALAGAVAVGSLPVLGAVGISVAGGLVVSWGADQLLDHAAEKTGLAAIIQETAETVGEAIGWLIGDADEEMVWQVPSIISWNAYVDRLGGVGSAAYDNVVQKFDEDWDHFGDLPFSAEIPRHEFEAALSQGIFDALLERLNDLVVAAQAEGVLPSIQNRILDLASFGRGDDFGKADFDPSNFVIRAGLDGLKDVALLHFTRNALMNAHVDFEPIDFVDIIFSDAYQKMPDALNAFHQAGAGNENNTKFLGPSGYSEYIIRETASGFEVVEEVRNYGSFNFASNIGANYNYLHWYLDMVPWNIFGNLPEEQTTFEERDIATIGGGLSFLSEKLVSFSDWQASLLGVDWGVLNFRNGESSDDRLEAYIDHLPTRIRGYGGNDTLVSGQHADYLDGGSGFDTADYSLSDRGVAVSLQNGRGYMGYASKDDWLEQLYNIEALVGSNYADVLIGDSGVNHLWGESGGDVLIGLGGADRLDGGSGSDTVDYRHSPFAVSVDLTTQTASGGHAQGDAIFSIENVTGSDHSDTLTGSSASNKLVGRKGNDTLDGKGGTDVLDGGAGDDVLTGAGTLEGGADNDTITGAGVIDGGTGDDVLHVMTADGTTYYSSSISGGGGTDHATLTRNHGGYGGTHGGLFLGALVDTTGTAHAFDAHAAASYSVFETALDLLASGYQSISYKYAFDSNYPHHFPRDYRFKSVDVSSDVERLDVFGGTGSTSEVIFHVNGLVYDGGAGNGDVFVADWSGEASALSWELDPAVSRTIYGVEVSNFERLHLRLGGGDDALTGGTGVDYFHGGGGHDTLTGGGGNDRLIGDAGNDVLNGGDGSSNVLDGGSGDDTLTGNGRLDGGAGDDVLTGAGTLEGGADNDTITGAGVIDGGTGDDVLHVMTADGTTYYSSSISGGGGTDHATLTRNHGGYGGTHGGLFLGALVDTTGTAHAFDAHAAASYSVFETALDLLASGYQSISYKYAFDSNYPHHFPRDYRFKSVDVSSDVERLDVFGGTGSTSEVIFHVNGLVYDGGAGNGDVFVADWSGEASALSWELDPAVSRTIYGVEVSNFERLHLRLGGGDDALTGGTGVDYFHGGGGHDTLTGGGGNDRLFGGDGDDVLEGGAGADVIAGGAGRNTLSYAGDTTGVNIDLAAGTAHSGDATGDTIAGEFSVTLGGSGNDTLKAAANGSRLIGNDGNDSLIGVVGEDQLFGGEGDDTIDGGDGADLLRGGDEEDSLVGGFGNDTLAGQMGDDFLDGGAGDDLFNGGMGVDTVIGGAGHDTLNLVHETASITLDLASQTVTGGNAIGDVISGIESANTGSGHDFVVGSDEANVIKAGEGNDTVTSGAGNDILRGQKGADVLSGDGGKDTLFGGSGSDTLDGGKLGDRIYGGDGDDEVFGGAGWDKLIAGDGADTVRGGIGNDKIKGQDGEDRLEGEMGDDWLNGGGSADTLFGGEGNDTLKGGNGSDFFVFADNFGEDVVVDFDANSSEIVDLSAVTEITSYLDMISNHLMENGGYAQITVGSNMILLEGVAYSDVLNATNGYTADIFVF